MGPVQAPRPADGLWKVRCPRRLSCGRALSLVSSCVQHPGSPSFPQEFGSEFAQCAGSKGGIHCPRARMASGPCGRRAGSLAAPPCPDGALDSAALRPAVRRNRCPLASRPAGGAPNLASSLLQLCSCDPPFQFS